jgi:hypothetical protein
MAIPYQAMDVFFPYLLLELRRTVLMRYRKISFGLPTNDLKSGQYCIYTSESCIIINERLEGHGNVLFFVWGI